MRWLGATCHAPWLPGGGALSPARGLPMGALDLRGLAGLDLGGLGLLVPLGLLDLDLRALEALYLWFPGGSLCDATSDPATQCQGKRQCTKSHTHIIACLRRTTNTSLENLLPLSGCRTSSPPARGSRPRLRGPDCPPGRRSQSRPPGLPRAPRCRCETPQSSRKPGRRRRRECTCRESPRPWRCDGARRVRSWRPPEIGRAHV